MKTYGLKGTLFVLSMSWGCGVATAQTASAWLEQQLIQQAEQRLDAELSFSRLELNTLLAELSARDLSLRSRIA